jgi:hypothetical protein
MVDSTAFGDTEAAVCDILRASTRIAAFDDVTIATDLDGFTYPDRRLRVTRTGGLPTLWMRLDNADIEIEALAETKSVAYDMASAARAAVFANRGLYSGNGLALYDVVDTSGLTWSPDPVDVTVCRYVFTLALVTKPTDVIVPVDPGPGLSTGPTVTPGGFIFYQDSPAAVWQVDHELAFDPAGIAVFSSDGYLCTDYGVQYLVAGRIVRLSFDISIAGVAYLS